jgi:hypothetical protein
VKRAAFCFMPTADDDLSILERAVRAF